MTVFDSISAALRKHAMNDEKKCNNSYIYLSFDPHKKKMTNYSVGTMDDNLAEMIETLFYECYSDRYSQFMTYGEYTDEIMSDISNHILKRMEGIENEHEHEQA